MSVHTLHMIAQRTLVCDSGQQKDLSCHRYGCQYVQIRQKISNQGCFGGVDQQSPAECHRWSGPRSPQDGTHGTIQKGPAT